MLDCDELDKIEDPASLLRSTMRLDEFEECMSAAIEIAFEDREGFPSYAKRPDYGSFYTSGVIETFYEHGQWWLRETFDPDETMEEDYPSHVCTYSVVDCNTHHGFDFELISDEEY